MCSAENAALYFMWVYLFTWRKWLYICAHIFAHIILFSTAFNAVVTTINFYAMLYVSFFFSRSVVCLFLLMQANVFLYYTHKYRPLNMNSEYMCTKSNGLFIHTCAFTCRTLNSWLLWLAKSLQSYRDIPHCVKYLQHHNLSCINVYSKHTLRLSYI